MRVETTNDCFPTIEMPRPFSVWMYGGGTQSAAIAVMILLGLIPTPNIAMIADTERERKTTWKYLSEVVQPAMPFPIHVIPKSKYATVDLFRNDDLLIPAFTDQSGKISKLETWCSNEWKVRVCERALRLEHGITAFQSWIGFSVDEIRRWHKMKESQGENVYFPLVEKEITRSKAIAMVLEHGWPEPPRSACYICPNQNDAEWASLPPDELAKAIATDAEIRQRDPHAFLHKSGKPLKDVVFKPSKEEPRPCDQAICMT